MQIAPTVFNGDETLKRVPVRERGCWFDDERMLEDNQAYSFKTCIAECTARAIFKLCKCVPFYYSTDANSKYFY